VKFYENREAIYRDYMPTACVAEVGVQRGFNASAILDAGAMELHLIDLWKHVDDETYSLDPANYDDSTQNFLFGQVLERFKAETQAGRVHIHRMASIEAARLFGDNSLDAVYLDAGHDYNSVMADLRAWEHAVNETGAIISHDFCLTEAAKKMGFNVVGAIVDFCEERKWKVVAMSTEDWPSVVIKRK
jgi:methyltransferase family protein